MEDARTAWVDVANKVESLGLKLKLHLEQETSETVTDRAQGETQNAFDELSSQVTDAFDAFGNAARDEGVRDDVRAIADLIKDALIETFQAVGAEIGEIIDQIEDYAENAAESMADAVGIDIDLSDDTSASPDAPEATVSDIQDTVESSEEE